MNSEEKTPEIALPESLYGQLQAFEKRLCVMETVVGVLGGLCGILLTYGCLFLSDRLWDTPWWIRGPLTLLGGVVLGGFAFRWMRHWWWRRRSTRELARLVQRQYGRMGDRLLGAVELANGGTLPDNISPALCRAAIRQVSREAAEYDFKQAVPTRRPRSVVLTFLLLMVVVAVTLLLAPEAGCNAMLRWAKPFTAVERYTFVSIESMPAQQVVPHGEAFEIGCQLAARSRWRPLRALCSIEDQPRIAARVIDGKAVFAVPGQTAPGVLAMRIGDITKRIAIRPVFRSELVQLSATVRLPDYLQRPPRELDIQNGRFTLLESSQVAFSGRISRDLGSARLLSITSDPTAATATPPHEAEVPLEIVAAGFTSREVAADRLDRLRFEWTDHHGLAPMQPYALAITTRADEPPFVECSGMSRAVAILEDEIVKLDVRGEDDFGMRELWVNWSSVDSTARGIPEVQGMQTLTNGAPDARVLEARFTFSPITAHVPEETLITLCAYAADYFPARKPAMSLVYRIYVLSRAKHAKLIQQQMEALQAKLEDLSRDEEALLDENKAIGEQTPEDLASAKTTEALKEKALDEASQAEQLARLAKETEALLKEALRNTEIPEETLRRWSELMEAMEQLAGGEMKESVNALQQAGRGKEARKEKLDEAVALEERILAALREMEEGINTSLADMLAKSFINRLRMAAATEQDIATTLGQLLPQTIGMSVDDLPADKRKTIDLLAARQVQTQKDAAAIRDDLAGFYNRTRIQCYDDVHSEMVAKKTADALTELAGLISQNVGVQAIDQSGVWQKQFVAWAELLEEKAAEGKSGECKGGEPGELDIETLIALMRARQREESLREQTRLVDQGRAENRAYEADARKLSKMQYELAADIRPLERKVRDPKLRRLVEKVGGEMMNAGMFLRKPQTDATTIAIETEIIELLANSVSAAAGACGGMAQGLMQAMGMQPGMGSGAGPKGGGSSAGGSADGASPAVAGGADHDGLGERHVEKVGGVDRGELPEEFRELLEAYFNALEEEE